MTEAESWAPLEGFARAVPEVDPTEWMFMGVCEDDGHPPLWSYKHIDSRRYLQLDQAGHAWDHIVATIDPDTGDLITYRPHAATGYRDVAAALAEHWEHLP
jgi:hypothetical protein